MNRPIFILIFLVFTSFSYSQQFVISGSVDYAPYAYITLVNISDNSVEWEGDVPKHDGKFSFLAKKGEYVLCLNNGGASLANYLLINLVSDTTLAEIETTIAPFSWDEIMSVPDPKYEKRYYLQSYTYGKDLLHVLNLFRIYDFRFEKKSKYIATVEINGVKLEKNIWELIQYFQSELSDDIMYIEKCLPTELFPRGFIRMKTFTREDPLSKIPEIKKYNINGSVHYPINCLTLINMSYNSIEWEGEVSQGRPFSVTVENGDYVLCISFGNSATYLSVNVLDEDIDLGIIQLDMTDKTQLEEQQVKSWEIELLGDTIMYVLDPDIKRHSILNVLNRLNIYDFKTNNQAKFVGIVEIDGVLIDKNIMDLVQYLQSQPAKDIEYVEKHSPTEQYPRGIIRIVTSSYKQ